MKFSPLKRVVRRTFKILTWLAGSVLFLILLLLILIQFPAVQNFAKDKIVSYLQGKLHTKVSIAKLSINFPKQIVLKGIYLEDQQKDTLLAGQNVRVDISMLKLLKGNVEINHVELDGITANVYRTGRDTVFNYQYIIDAFADTTRQKEEDTAAGMQFKVGKLVLNNINSSFRDEQTGMDFLIHLGKSQVAFETFDPAKMNFSVPLIAFDSVAGHMYQNKPLLAPEPAAKVEAESNEPFQLSLALKQIGLTNIQFDYRNDVSPMRAHIDMGELSADVQSVDLSKLDVQVNKIKLRHTKANLALGKSVQTAIAKEEVKKEVNAQANNPWKIFISDADFANNDIVYDDDNVAPVKTGMDYSHIAIDSFTLKAGNILLTPTGYSGDIAKASFSEKSGFVLQDLQTKFTYSDTGASLKNLRVQTDKTIIQDEISLAYDSLASVIKDIGSLYVNASLQQCKLSVKDILTFAPQLQPNLKGFENAVIAINAKVNGYVKDIAIPSLQVSGIGSAVMNISGRIKGLPDPAKTSYDVRINNFTAGKADILHFLPGNLQIPVSLPGRMTASGTFKGSAENFITDALLQTDKGNAKVSGSLNMAAKTYNMKGELQDADLGYLLQDTMIGRLTMSFMAKGSGFEPAAMNTDAAMNVSSAYIQGYNYKNLTAKASVRKGYSKITADMHDPNIAFGLNASALVKEKAMSDVKLDLDIDSLALKTLGFTKDDIRLRGRLLADIPVADMEQPVGSIRMDNVTLQYNNDVYSPDSITITANKTDSGQLITLQSQVLNADLLGTYKLSSIANGPMQVLNKYYSLGLKDSAINDHWRLNAAVIPDSLLFAILPSLAGTDTIRATMQFNGAADSLAFTANAPAVKSGGILVDSLTVKAATGNDAFVYGAAFNKAGSKSFMIQRTVFSGYAKNNALTNDLLIKDADGKDKYELAFKVASEKNGTRINLLDTLLLDYDRWATDRSNYILLDSTGIVVRNFSIENNEQLLRIHSQSESPQAPVDITLKSFRIKTITDFAEQDSLVMDGVINGSTQVKDIFTNPAFTSDITINDLSYNNDTLGNLVVKVDNQTADTYNAHAALKGNGNNVELNGKYVSGNGAMDLLLTIDSLNLAALRSLSQGAVTDASGNLQGRIDIKGTASAPAVNGELQFINAGIMPAITGEKLHLSDEKIKVTGNNVHFDEFTLVDSAGNKAILDGDIFTNNFTSYSFDLTLNADDFRVLNSTQQPNALYYGRLNVDADIAIKGPMEAPSVNADLTVNKQTDVTIILPGPNPELENREGVVVFFDAYGNEDRSKKVRRAADSLFRVKKLAGMDISATIQSDTAAQITLVTDERSGDAIKIRGKANLAGGIDKSGKISLTGSYQLQSGWYQVSLSVLKKQFAVQPGSIITWNGDATSATVDITANYTANTQPINLLQSELASLSPADLNRYKARVPFNVVLMMKGDLMKPVITFDIKLDDEQKTRWPDVESKLEYIRGDEGELNKQVFALLLLNRFVQENPLKNSAEGTSLATTVKTSVSKILADQINNLAGSLIQGVDLNFGINAEDDYTSGTPESRTDLTVGVSKKLLNDRLRVSVGSNFELEGPANANENASNIAGDIAVDYLLSKDGRYTLRTYRRNRYEGVVEGQVVESGISFLFTLDFDSLKQLFKKPTPEQKRQREEDKRVEKEQKAIEKEKNKKASL